jgi:hypothetical protein
MEKYAQAIPRFAGFSGRVAAWTKGVGHDQLAVFSCHARECYYAAMRRLPLPLLVLIILIASPVAIPTAIVSWIRDHRRMRAVAERTHCESCGATLGAASQQSADAQWSKRVAARLHARPDIRIRMVRKLWAICSTCGAEYDYDFRNRIFHRVAGSDEPRDPDKAASSSTIPNLDDRVWLPAARPVADFVCDVSFRIDGKLTSLRDADTSSRRESLVLAEVAPPELPRRGPSGIITADIVAHTEELVAYYRRLIAAAEEAGLTDQVQRPFLHFAVKPVIIADTELTEFAWYDSVGEASTVLRAIATCPLNASEPEEFFDDLDQGWRGRLAVWREQIGLVEWNWEQTALSPTPGYSFDAAQLAKQADAALERLDVIHRELVQAFGRDYWNYR